MTSKISKKAHECIQKFNYSLNHTLCDLFKQDSDQTKLHFPLTKTTKNNLIHFYTASQFEGVSTIDYQAIIESAKKIYIQADSIKINDLSFKKNRIHKLDYLPISGDFHEIIEFVILSDEGNKTPRQNSKIKGQSKIKEELIVGQTETKVNLNKKYELYVIHHCQSEIGEQNKQTIRWENLIEKYQFNDVTESGISMPFIKYWMIFTHQETGFMEALSLKYKLYETYLQSYCSWSNGVIQNLPKMQGYLLQSKDRLDKIIKQMNDPAFQDDKKRWLKLPAEYYKSFVAIRKQTLNNFKEVSKNKLSEGFFNNLICRYLYAKDYDQKESQQSVVQYLKWYQTMTNSYNLNSFKDIHSKDIYTFLGYDFDGRAVILNKASKVKVDQLPSQQYCNYYIYYLQIFLQKKMKGFNDQVYIIADLEGLSSANFKLSMTKRNIADSLKYSAERQYKLVAVNVATFAYTCWAFLKPLLPKKTLHKINVLGTDKAQIVDFLTKEMDISIIPKYLGGQNMNTFETAIEEDQSKIE